MKPIDILNECLYAVPNNQPQQQKLKSMYRNFNSMRPGAYFIEKFDFERKLKLFGLKVIVAKTKEFKIRLPKSVSQKFKTQKHIDDLNKSGQYVMIYKDTMVYRGKNASAVRDVKFLLPEVAVLKYSVHGMPSVYYNGIVDEVDGMH